MTIKYVTQLTDYISEEKKSEEHANVSDVIKGSMEAWGGPLSIDEFKFWESSHEQKTLHILNI